MEYCRRTLPLTFCFASLCSQSVIAAEWVAEPTINLREEYNDNIRLSSRNAESVWGTTLDPRIRLSRKSELWDLNAAGRIRAKRYSGQDGLNTVDNFLQLGAEREFERGSLSATAGLTNDTTLQDEVLDFDTGLTVVQVDRTQRKLTLGGDYSFTESTWTEIAVDYSEQEYDQGERFGLLDYDYLTPTLRIVHQYSPQTQLFGILSHSNVDYDTVTELESKTDSLQIGAAYDINERWNVTASIGSRRTKTSSMQPMLVAPIPGLEPFCGVLFVCDIVYVPSDTESTGVVYDASLNREFEAGRLSLSATQSVTPSSTGTDTESTRITVEGTRNLSAKFAVQLAVSYYQSSTVGEMTTRADSDRFRVAPSATWRFDRDLALNAGYTYTRIDRDTASIDSVDSNAVFVSLAYEWPRMAVSR